MFLVSWRQTGPPSTTNRTCRCRRCPASGCTGRQRTWRRVNPPRGRARNPGPWATGPQGPRGAPCSRRRRQRQQRVPTLQTRRLRRATVSLLLQARVRVLVRVRMRGRARVRYSSRRPAGWAAEPHPCCARCCAVVVSRRLGRRRASADQDHLRHTPHALWLCRTATATVTMPVAVAATATATATATAVAVAVPPRRTVPQTLARVPPGHQWAVHVELERAAAAHPGRPRGRRHGCAANPGGHLCSAPHEEGVSDGREPTQ